MDIITGYLVVSEPTVRKLEERVNEYITGSWIPYGNLVAVNEGQDKPHFLQPMVKIK